MKKIISLCIPILLIIANISCNTRQEKNEMKTVVILLDLSKSVRNEETKKNYREIFHKVLDKMTEGDRLILLKITEFSIVEPDIPVNEQIPVFVSSTTNDLRKKKEKQKYDESIKKQKELIAAGFDSVLNEEKVHGGTDIMTSVGNARKAFTAFPAEKQALVIMSDMMESSQRYNFYRLPESERSYSDILKKETDAGRIPDLPHVKIYVCGAYSASQKKYELAKVFWMNYFSRAGAVLQEENYGATIMNFNE